MAVSRLQHNVDHFLELIRHSCGEAHALPTSALWWNELQNALHVSQEPSLEHCVSLVQDQGLNVGQLSGSWRFGQVVLESSWSCYKTTAAFKDADKGIMFASDVVGRGMDFPNVDLVVQVGLPSNAEQYIHRVGRTARAGNDGHAVILFTESESIFMSNNRKLPIKPHPDTNKILADVQTFSPQVMQAMYNIDEVTKQRAYSSYIGFFAGSGLMRPLRLDKPGLVQLANELAVVGMGCPEPPAMDKKVVGKMGLKGVPGFNYASGNDLGEHRPQNRPQRQNARAGGDPFAPRTDRVDKTAGGRGGGRGGGGRGGSRGGRGGPGRGGRGGSGRGGGQL